MLFRHYFSQEKGHIVSMNKQNDNANEVWHHSARVNVDNVVNDHTS